MDLANHAATLHAHLCEHDWHGYTQGSGRWGDGSDDWVDVDGVNYNIGGGDRDCSSSIIDCWQKVLANTTYKGCLDSATYTGNMRAVFVNSGLFEWHSMGDGYTAQRGDIYLNEASHTAMCQSAEPDTLSEFCINENGGITGGAVGDQTGSESLIRGYYNFPWDGILAYNHGADESEDDVSAEDVWNFDQNGTLMRDRVQGIDSAANSANSQLTRNDDVTGEGTSGNMYDRVCWADKRAREIAELLNDTNGAAAQEETGQHVDTGAKPLSRLAYIEGYLKQLTDTNMEGVEKETGEHVNTGANMNTRIAYMEAEQKRQAKVIDAIAKKLEVTA